MPNVIGPTTIPIPPFGFDILGISLSDTFAASDPRRMVMRVAVRAGTISMAGYPAAPAIRFRPTFAEATAALATLRYTGTGPDTLTIDVWNQEGTEYGYAAPIVEARGRQ